MNYIGSKFSLLDFLDKAISDITGYSEGIFCDLFAGTGVVGLRFKQKGFNVISNDIQYYSYAINKHRIANHAELSFKGLVPLYPELDVMDQTQKYQFVCGRLNEILPMEGFIYQNYASNGRQYFTEHNAKMCDAIRTQIDAWKQSGYITDNEFWFLLASLLISIDKVANTASVYGAFLKHIKRTAQANFRLSPLPLYASERGHSVYNENANDLVRTISADIVYIDPPYNHRQYSGNYHILETIALNDNPTIKGKTGLRAEDSKQSKYCQKRQVKNVFIDLISNIKAKYIFVSYNNDGLLSKDDLKEILSSKGEYGCIEKDYKRFQADISKNRKINDKNTIEFLHYVKCN